MSPNWRNKPPEGSGEQPQAFLFFTKAPRCGGDDCFAPCPPVRGGISVGGGPCVVFIPGEGLGMGKLRHRTAGSDPICISPRGLGPSWGIPACLGRAAGRERGQRGAGGNGVEGGGSQLRVETAAWRGAGGCQQEGGQVWDCNEAAWQGWKKWGAGQGSRAGSVCGGQDVWKRDGTGQLPTLRYDR